MVELEATRELDCVLVFSLVIPEVLQSIIRAAPLVSIRLYHEAITIWKTSIASSELPVFSRILPLQSPSGLISDKR